MKDSPTSVTRKISLTATSDLFIEPTAESLVVEPRRFALLIFCDDEAQLTLLTEDSNVVVGREPPSEVIVNDPSVSSQHARFTLSVDSVSVEDLDSRNGTFLRGERVESSRLAGGDEVRIGKARVVLAATRPGNEPAAELIGRVPDQIVGNPKMKALYADASRAAQATAPVLILGETGVGKELIAAAIHREGPRREKPFVVVNCGAIPTGLIESTLFGHERGAFTGAAGRAIGVFERANGGVLFLDEVGELGSSAQVALLRVIETGRVQRLGASCETPVDVRIVAATHCDLEGMIAEQTFRKDLFFRLSGVVFQVPPLRERLDELPAMARLFLGKARAQWGARPHELEPKTIALLERYSWPGNVRQLRHAVERAALLARGEIVRPADLPEYVLQAVPSKLPEAPAPPQPPPIDLALREQMLRYERMLIEEALRRAAGNRQVAAKLLRIPLRTLFRRMNACGVRGSQDPQE